MAPVRAGEEEDETVRQELERMPCGPPFDTGHGVAGGWLRTGQTTITCWRLDGCKIAGADHSGAPPIGRADHSGAPPIAGADQSGAPPTESKAA